MRPPPVQDLGWTRLDDPSSVGSVRRAVVHTARAIAFREDRVAEVALAATELATNAIKDSGTDPTTGFNHLSFYRSVAAALQVYAYNTKSIAVSHVTAFD